MKETWSLKPKRIPVPKIRLSNLHWSREYTEEGIDELKASIKAHGQFHEILVRPPKKGEEDYRLISGGRRLIAIKSLGHYFLNARVADVDDLTAEQMSLEENLRAEKPTAKDWGRKVDRWRQIENIKRGYKPKDRPRRGRPIKTKKPGPVSTAEIAEQFNLSKRSIENVLRREEHLISIVKAAWRLGKITEAQADILAKTPKEEQKGVLQQFTDQRIHDEVSAEQDRQLKNKDTLMKATKLDNIRLTLRKCEVLCHKQLVKDLRHLINELTKDEILKYKLVTVVTQQLTESRDLIDELLDRLST